MCNTNNNNNNNISTECTGSFVTGELQGLVPLLSSPAFEDIMDTSVEMSGLVTESTFGGIELTSVEMSGFEDNSFGMSGVAQLQSTSIEMSGEDDFVAGCGEWFGGSGMVHAYYSLITPPLINSTMVEPVRALSPRQVDHDITMCETVDEDSSPQLNEALEPVLNGQSVEWGSLTLDTSTERLLDAVVEPSQHWESFSLDASTERLLDGVVGDPDLWESFALDASTERLLDAAPTCTMELRTSTERMLDALAEPAPAGKYSQLPNVVFSADNNNRLLKCTFIGLGSGCNFVSGGFNPNSEFDYTRRFFNTESFNTIPIRNIAVVAGILSRMAENLSDDLPGAPVVILRYGVTYTQLAGRKVELNYRDVSLVLTEIEIKQFVGISEYLVSEDRRVVDSMAGEENIWHRYMMFLDNVAGCCQDVPEAAVDEIIFSHLSPLRGFFAELMWEYRTYYRIKFKSHINWAIANYEGTNFNVW